MKTCALRPGQTKPGASKGSEGFAAGVVMLLISPVYCRVVGPQCLISEYLEQQL